MVQWQAVYVSHMLWYNRSTRRIDYALLWGLMVEIIRPRNATAWCMWVTRYKCRAIESYIMHHASCCQLAWWPSVYRYTSMHWSRHLPIHNNKVVTRYYYSLAIMTARDAATCDSTKWVWRGTTFIFSAWPFSWPYSLMHMTHAEETCTRNLHKLACTRN